MRIKLLLLFFFISFQIYAQRLDPFLSKSYVAMNGDTRELLPYEKPVRFFDYINQTTSADTIDSSSIGYYIYFSLFENVKEIGIRLLSPVPELASPNKGDYETETYTSLSLHEKSMWFDAGFVLEYGTPSTENTFNVVYHMGENHQSKEAPPQPDGRYHNALFRLVREDLPAGEYRITLVIERNEPSIFPTGSYLLEIGTVPAVKIDVKR